MNRKERLKIHTVWCWRQTQVDWEIQLHGYLTSTSIFRKKLIHDWPPIPWWISPSSIHNHNPDIMIDNWILLWMRHTSHMPVDYDLIISGYYSQKITGNYIWLYLVITGMQTSQWGCRPPFGMKRATWFDEKWWPTELARSVYNYHFTDRFVVDIPN